MFLRGFLETTGIQLDYQIGEPVWNEAGRRFARYAERRRRAVQQGPRRLLADFVIGAHALLMADRLLTLDPTRYQQDFAELSLP